MKSCQDCPKRSVCVELCPEAEACVDQDHVSQQEMFFDQDVESENLDFNPWPEPVEIRSANHLKQLICALHRDGKSATEIAYHLPCSHSYICRVIQEEC